MSATCSSCGAAIEWATTENGKRMPVDAKPLTLPLPGVFRLRWTPGNPVPLAVSVKREEGFYNSHFATCPNAASHRRAKPASEAAGPRTEGA